MFRALMTLSLLLFLISPFVLGDNSRHSSIEQERLKLEAIITCIHVGEVMSDYWVRDQLELQRWNYSSQYVPQAMADKLLDGYEERIEHLKLNDEVGYYERLVSSRTENLCEPMIIRPSFADNENGKTLITWLDKHKDGSGLMVGSYWADFESGEELQEVFFWECNFVGERDTYECFEIEDGPKYKVSKESIEQVQFENNLLFGNRAHSKNRELLALFASWR
ncbi:hypothetical protein IC617_08825 [Neiella sp. HB171785]|uniref:Uncharacterized protein n=1 Tax=Neiella litorisoli TaxID=2771431 RepID=A0A8J6R2U9_9GAMM|nr:hypothetical protein [Neiella litorisoli]MBD1389530.1 hypothetical protein [Neiella litorisoli]